MIRKILLVTMALLACLWPLGAAAEVTPAMVISRVQTLYDKAGGFQARFLQVSRVKAAGASDSAAGWMYFKRPCRMRWQYETPPEQKKEIISDGRLVWMYMPADSMVMVYKLDKVLRSDLVMRFFSGIGLVQKDFNISWERPPKEGTNYVIDLFPKKSQPELKRLTLSINPDTYLVEQLNFSNALGEESRFTFTQIKLGVPFGPAFFTFKPPPGVQVIRQTSG
ncbi:MAG: outer membrane lipoprotein carrier protein LolA [Deltaproteobacteria bacterium]